MGADVLKRLDYTGRTGYLMRAYSTVRVPHATAFQRPPPR